MGQSQLFAAASPLWLWLASQDGQSQRRRPVLPPQRLIRSDWWRAQSSCPPSTSQIIPSCS